MNYPLEQFYRAYRKAKNEAFRDTNCAHGLKFAQYEHDLAGNLSRLRQRLRQSASWRHDLGFIGEVVCIPKSVDPPVSDGNTPPVHYHVSEPMEQWMRECSASSPARADFRPVIDATVDFMVVSALWILEVGHQYDECLDTRYAVGNRLRRWRADESAPTGTPGELNLISPNLFAPYFTAYGKWRSNGLAAMRAELDDGHRIVAVTMDLKRFYHHVDSSFLLDRRYLRRIGLRLTQPERRFTRLLLDAFATWNRSAHLRYGCPDMGLPVGLTASGLIANVILAEFDSRVVSDLSPRHYGRYVDDVFLVLRRDEPFESGEAFITWMAAQLGTIAEASIANINSHRETSLRIHFPYAAGSELIFAGKKQKIFQLAGEHGLDLINPIEEQIRQNTSEFKDLPHIPNTEGAMAHRALLVTPDAQLEADALRKADAVTLRRSGFAMLLGDLEAHARDLDPDSWQTLRREFYGLAERHLLAPKALFDFSRYLPRIIGLMVACQDWNAAIDFVGGLAPLKQCLLRTCAVENGSLRTCITDAFANLGKRCIESVLQAARAPNGQTLRLLQRIRRVMGVTDPLPRTVAPLRAAANNLLLLDWSREPYAETWLEASGDVAASPQPRSRSVRAILPLEEIQLFRETAGLNRPHWPALAFPTRPISVNEITAHAPDLLLSGELFSQVVRGLRGTWMPVFTELIVLPETATMPPQVFVPGPNGGRPTVAITSLEVTNREWERAAQGRPILTLERYQRLNSLLDGAVAAKPRRPNYVLLPELSLPRRWMMRTVGKLVNRGVSVIGGVEYRTDSGDPNLLHNQAVVALRTTYPGHPRSLVLLQSKAQAAWGEAQFLASIGKSVGTARPGPFDRPVYVHGAFCFGVLICSDLTDIRNRSRFQGKVDCLFVPEWNRDIASFAALVESAALDIHAFIAQANNRRYGDSRLRAPMKESFHRDLVQLKGGKNDYFVIGEIDFIPLRAFQSNPSPPNGGQEIFKPFPIGFPSNLSLLRRQ